MVMETTFRAKKIDKDALQTLGTQIYTLLGETSFGIKCTLKNNRLVVLGEHPADASPLDASMVLDRLESTIQALQLQFTQQVRLYLRHLGQQKPYAYRQFVLLPPPPSLLSVMPAEQSSSSTDEKPWIVGDAELDALVNQLTALDPLDNWDIVPQEELEQEASLDEDTSEHFRSEQQINDRADSEQISYGPQADSSANEVQSAIASPMVAKDNRSNNMLASEHHDLLEDGLIPDAEELKGIKESSERSPEQGAPAVHDRSDSTLQLLELDTQNIPTPQSEKDAACNQAILSSTDSDLSKSFLKQSQSAIIVSDVASKEKSLLNPRFSSFTYETSQRLKELSQSLLHSKTKESIEKLNPQQSDATAHLEKPGYRRVAIATMGIASLGLATGLYGVTRPCVIGSCSALLEADRLGQKSQRVMQQAQNWVDIEAAIPPLNQALEILEPIPVWSSHISSAKTQREHYTLHLSQINQLLEVEQAAKHANQLSSQTVYSFEDLQTVRSLWKSAIDDLELLPIDSPLHEFAQTYLADYQPQLVTAEQQLQKEQTAINALETAQEAAQLAQVRQGVAQSLENWQFARVTWLVALNRLKQVTTDTLAGEEAQRLMAFYQTSLDEVNAQVSSEKVASTSLVKAKQHAQIAAAAEQRHDWQRAIADWNSAIQSAQEIDNGSTYYLKAEKLLTQYQDSVARVQDQLKAKTLIEGELKQSCVGELRLCHIVSIDQSIKIELDESYMDAISTARGNGNYNLQAVVTDHQLMVRQSLDRIANNFDLPIEVYNPEGGLLERHLPKPH
ncbi:MAG: hypothetical protein AAGD25_12235 [Cyanobacteria bacterium P01_F01_bin.150]